MSTGNGNGFATFDWKKWLASQGVMAVFLAFLAYFVAFFIFLPMRDDQRAYIQAMVKTNEIAAIANAKNAESYAALVTMHQLSAIKLDSIHDEQKKTTDAQQQATAVLREIRDDQKRGAWWDKDKAKQGQ